jgi:site-specific DNA recombinase
VSHHGSIYAVEHEAIVSCELWDAVQETLARQRVERKRGTSFDHPSLLAERILDGEGRRMAPSHAVKSGRRYRYYATYPTECAPGGPPAWRVPAYDVKAAAVRLIQTMLADRRQIMSIVGANSSAILNKALFHAGAARRSVRATSGRS